MTAQEGSLKLEEQIRQLLLTWDEYRERDWQPPLEFKFEKPGQKFEFVGVRHSHDPKNPELAELKRKFQAFSATQGTERSIVFVEGGVPDTENKVEAEQIRKDGESGLITLMAERAGMHVDSPEPDSALVTSQLLEKFSVDEVLTYYLARRIDQWHRMPDRPELEPYATPPGKYLHPLINPELLSWEALNQAFERVTGKRISPEYESTMREYSDPSINAVARECSNLRDVHIVKRILDEWEAGKSIFATFGWSHLAIQEPALRALLK